MFNLIPNWLTLSVTTAVVPAPPKGEPTLLTGEATK